MIKKISTVFLIFALLALVTAYDAIFTVDQTEKALILQFGRPVSQPLDPGLHFKLPFVQKVVPMDMRLLDYEAPQAELLTHDQKALVVDAFMRWRIVDPLKFYQSFKPADPRVNINEEARKRLGGIVAGELRRELGLHVMADIIFSKRNQIMAAVTELSNKKAHEWGVEIIDVRIKRADLPVENQKAVYARMSSERAQEAQLYRSQGVEESQKMRASADLEKAEILARAHNENLKIRGEADAQAAQIYASAYGQDPEFYDFNRSLESYRIGLSSNTTLVLSPEDNEYLKYMGHDNLPKKP